jgi:hypothetical protein
VAIPCGPYLPHGAFVEFFTLSWAVERWNLSSMSLLLSPFLKSIRENMVTKKIWFLNLRHSGTLFLVCLLTLAQQMFLFTYPLNVKYVELIGKEKGYNSTYVYCQVKGRSKKELRKLSQWFWKEFLKWYDGGGENGITSKRIFLMLKCFSPLRILTSPLFDITWQVA